MEDAIVAANSDLTELHAVSETLFLPLYALAIESRTKGALLCDERAAAVAADLDSRFADSDRKIHRLLVERRLPRLLVTTLVVRIRYFDHLVRSFLEREPDGIVVSLGCGLSTRRWRLDNGWVRWFDLDLPEVTAVRRRYFADNARLQSMSSSVLDFEWMDALPRERGERYFFLAEGLFMYLEKESVRRIVEELQRRFPGAELAAEVASRRMARISASALGRGKLRRRFGLSGDVWFHSGLANPREIESWTDATFLGDWSYFDDGEQRLHFMSFFARWELVRRGQYVVHYRLLPLEAAREIEDHLVRW